MSAKLRRFAQARLAEQSSSKSGGVMSLREIEDLFVKKLCEKCNLVERDIARVFRKFDKDNSGSIDSSELEHLMRVFRKEITSEEVTKMMQSCKHSESGEISFQEFVPMMVPVFKLNDRYIFL